MGALDWFKNLKNTRNAKLLQCDIESFYPSISKELLLRALNFASNFTYISELSKEIIMHSRKGVLWHHGSVWVKQSDPDFDITMGSFDGAECSEVVGLYLLHEITETHKIFDKNEAGLFRDDMAAITRGGGPVSERKKKELIRVMKAEGLNITIRGFEQGWPSI